MNHHKRAFTAIELIFVIVIIGILASVAVTKLSATREDAVVATLSNRIDAMIGEIGAYALARDGLDGNVSDFTNIGKEMVAQQIAHEYVDANGSHIGIKAGNVDDCINLRVEYNETIAKLTIEINENGNDPICERLQQRISKDNFSVILRGHLAKF